MASVLYSNPVMGTQIQTGDKLYFYQAGTSSLLTVYTDEALTAPAPSPIAANADGRFVALFFASADGDAKVVLESTFGVEKWTVDNYPVNDLSGIIAQSGQNASDIGALEVALGIAESDIDALELVLGGVSDTLFTAKDDNPLALVGTEFGLKDGYGGAPSAVLIDQYSSSAGTELLPSTWTAMPLQTFISNRIGATVSNNKITLGPGTFYIEYSIPLRNIYTNGVSDTRVKMENSAGDVVGVANSFGLNEWGPMLYTGVAEVPGETAYELFAYANGPKIDFRPGGSPGIKMGASLKVWKISDS